MRGGLERWKRGAESHGVRQALNYALKGTCDAHLRPPSGVAALDAYAGDGATMRFIVREGRIVVDELGREGLARWVDGCDPETGERRGRELLSADADLVLDGTINAPKTFSIAALLHPELAAEFEALQDRLRDRIMLTWQRELNARRGAGGRIREPVRQIEVVELQHRRSRALDPHVHRHLWLNVRVEGSDGKWSNVDSRVAMRLHNVINAEGELAACTDPEWVATLAAHGFTLNTAGEIAELAHLVRPLSRRSNQIESNRARLIAKWQAAHPGEEPSPDLLAQIDRRAWAIGRPNKPPHLSEDTWEHDVRMELRHLDAAATRTRPRRLVIATALSAVDELLLSARAVVDADERSTSTGGRFSSYDIRAGALRAVAGSGVVIARSELDALVARVEDGAIANVVDLLAGEATAPGHVKCFMASETVRLKLRLAGRLDALATGGSAFRREHVDVLAVALDVPLGLAQVDGVAAVAGGDRLVTVTGPAGAGKTTMLRVARAALEQQHRRMVVVAPTRKAAEVVAREIGATATSMHALLHDHGFRWTTEPAGSTAWLRLARGEIDPATKRVYPGPARFPVDAGDRIVVDEAGMVDLQAANALTELALETGAGIAMVGDPLQALPVGHAGAMAAATRRATTTVELDSVHRFADPDYGAITLRIRNPHDHADALAIATELHTRGHIEQVSSLEAARQVMVDGYIEAARAGHRVALIAGSNADADAINDAIQQHRIDAGQLDPRRLAFGQDEQRIFVGDIVQTRRNDTTAGVQNRATWVVRTIGRDHIDVVSVTDSGDHRRISTAYAADYLHLAYATTVHGIQGETTHTSIVGPDVDAAGLYVGLTRGRHHNTAITIAHATADAIETIAQTMVRGAPELSIQESLRAARAELSRAAVGASAPLTASVSTAAGVRR